MAANGSELFLDRHTRVRKIQQIAAFLAQIEGKDPQVNTTNRRAERESEIYFYTKKTDAKGLPLFFSNLDCCFLDVGLFLFRGWFGRVGFRMGVFQVSVGMVLRSVAQQRGYSVPIARVEEPRVMTQRRRSRCG